MIRLLGLGAFCFASVAGPAAAQEPDLAELARARAALAELPPQPPTGAHALQVVHWRTGAPLPDAIVVEVPGNLSVPLRRQDEIPGWERQRAWLLVAAGGGIRLQLDDRARTRFDPDLATLVIVHGDDFAVSGDVSMGIVSPCPGRALPVEVVDAAGRRLNGQWVSAGGWGVTDRRGRTTLWFDDRHYATQRHVLVGVLGHGLPAWRYLPRSVPQGSALLDLHALDAVRQPLRLVVPATASVGVRGVCQGEPAAYPPLLVRWQEPFGAPRAFSRPARSAEVLTGLPVGLPVRIDVGQRQRPLVVRPRADARVRVELPVSQPFRGVRYRLVDEGGRVLRGGLGVGGIHRYVPERGRWVVPAGDEPVAARLDLDGEVWSCAPFRLPRVTRPGILDGGDLVLVRDSTALYCEGTVVDTAGRPVRTRVALTSESDHWASAGTDAEGRFRICIGPWFQGHAGLRVCALDGVSEHDVKRGDRAIRVVVDPTRPVMSTIVGEVLGLAASAPLWPPLRQRVRPSRSGEPYREFPSLRSGTLRTALAPGIYDVQVLLVDGTVLLEATGIEVGEREVVAPAGLRRPLPPTHRLATVQVVDAAGQPCPVAGFTSDVRAAFCTVIPVGGVLLDLPVILQRVTVRGDCRVIYDPVPVPVQVGGLPADSGWHFGLGVMAEGSLASEGPARLLDGAATLLVPRGVPLRCELLAMRYGEEGLPEGCSLVRLTGFDAAFAVDAPGAAALQFDAPKDLAAQLATRRGPSARPGSGR